MSANNIVAPGTCSFLLSAPSLSIAFVLIIGIEKLGVRTFSSLEICFNITALLHPRMIALAQNCPVLADINGGKKFEFHTEPVSDKLLAYELLFVW